MAFIPILVGLALLFAGRKLFWLAVATIGFIAGMELAGFTLDFTTESTRLLIALGVGLLCALAAVLLQKIAVGLAGFLAGGYAAFLGMNTLGVHLGGLGWAPIVVCGIAGVVITALVFKWALIIVSSLVGSYLLVTSIAITASAAGPLFLILAITGMIVQGRSAKKKQAGTTGGAKESNRGR
jgi:hypothetical protein